MQVSLPEVFFAFALREDPGNKVDAMKVQIE